jgi:hypothetical protein
MAGRTDVDICNLALLYSGVNIRIGSLNDKNSAEAQACNTLYAEHRQNMMSELHWPFAQRRKQLFPLSGVAWDAVTAFNNTTPVTYGANVYRSLQDGNVGNVPSDDASAAWWVQVTRDGYLYVCPLPDDCLDPIEMWPKINVSALSSVPTGRDYRNDTGFNLRAPRADQREPFILENANDGTDLQVILTDLLHPILRYTADVSNPSVFPTEFAEALAWDLAGPLARGLRGDEKKGDSCEKMAVKRMGEAFIINMRDQREDQQPVSEFEAAREGC